MTRWFYVVGCLLLIPASVALFSESLLLQSVSLFIGACLFLFVAGCLDVLAFMMQPERDLKWSYMWTVVLAYCLGGSCFFFGSVLFLPSLEMGVLALWVFRMGSCCYLIGSAILLVRRELGARPHALISYISGSLLYVTGGILSEMGHSLASFSTAWLLGSIMFFVGAILNLPKRPQMAQGLRT